MSYAFYPGCSLGATGLPYAMSTRHVLDVLGVAMPELEDWNCCGTSAFQVLDEVSSLSLSGRNLALAEQGGYRDLVTPCSGCYLYLRKASHALATSSQMKEKGDASLAAAGVRYDGGVQVRHLLDVLVKDVGLDRIRAAVAQGLGGIKVACYYGCLLTRPPAVSGVARPEDPDAMDRLVAALGAEPLDWSFKTECCGAASAVARPDVVARLTGRILDNAREVGADMVVTACPLCHANLDMNHAKSGGRLPVVYFTELMGIAFGISPGALGLGKHLRDPVPALCRYNLVG